MWSVHHIIRTHSLRNPCHHTALLPWQLHAQLTFSKEVVLIAATLTWRVLGKAAASATNPDRLYLSKLLLLDGPLTLTVSSDDNAQLVNQLVSQTIHSRQTGYADIRIPLQRFYERKLTMWVTFFCHSTKQ